MKLTQIIGHIGTNTSEWDNRLEELAMILKEAFQRPIAFHRAFVSITGSVEAAVLLSQAIYWSERTQDSNGWFWKTQEQWEEETGMSYPHISRARQRLKACSFWQEDLRGAPPKMYYRVDFVELARVLQGKVRPLTLDECLDIYGTKLRQLSKAALMRAKKAKVEAEHVNYADILRRHGLVCYLCQDPIQRGPGSHPQDLAFDHVLPICAGGPHSADNIRPSHVKCNVAKADGSIEDFQLSYGKKINSLTQRKLNTLTERELTPLQEDELNALSLRKNSIHAETTSEITAETTGRAPVFEAANELLPPLMTAYEAIANTQAKQVDLKNQAILLQVDGVTVSELTDWLKLGSYPPVKCIRDDVARWRARQNHRRQQQQADAYVGKPSLMQAAVPTVFEVRREGKWGAIFSALEMVFDVRGEAGAFWTWLAPLEASREQEGVLYLSAPDAVFCTFIENNYLDRLNQAAVEAGLLRVMIEVAVEARPHKEVA